MNHFLNDFMKEKRNWSNGQLDAYRMTFERTFSFIREALGDRAFRPDRSLNTAVLDSVAPSIALMLESRVVMSAPEAKEAYENLLENGRFIEGYIRSTADAENVRKRSEEARKAFGVE